MDSFFRAEASRARKPPKRTVRPVLLSEGRREIFKNQIERLNEENFSNQENWGKMLISFLRCHIFYLADAKIFKQGPTNIGRLNEQIEEGIRKS